MTAIEIACPTCAAQPGNPCRVWPGCGRTWENVDYLHPSRIDGAQFVTSLDDRAADPSEVLPVTDEAIDRTGLL